MVKASGLLLACALLPLWQGASAGLYGIAGARPDLLLALVVWTSLEGSRPLALAAAAVGGLGAEMLGLDRWGLQIGVLLAVAHFLSRATAAGLTTHSGPRGALSALAIALAFAARAGLRALLEGVATAPELLAGCTLYTWAVAFALFALLGPPSGSEAPAPGRRR